MVVSIHTPIQGVTSTKSQEPGGYYSFNPHTHTGCDYVSSAALNYAQVSIHTPIQGVTSEYAKKTEIPKFQSTHPYRV